MRHAITIGRRHGETAHQVIKGPEVPIQDHHAALKAARESREHADFAEIEVWESGRGRVRRQRFEPPAPPKAKAGKP